MIKKLLTTALYCAIICPPLACMTVTNGQQSDNLPCLMPATTTAAFSIKPAEILKSPGMEMVPREVLSVLGQTEFGIDPCKIQNAVLMVDSFTDLRNPPGFGMVISFAEPQTLGGNITDSLIKGSYEGMAIYRSRDAQTPLVLQYNETTLIVGLEPFVKKMLASKNASGKLANLIAAASSDSQFSAFMIMAPVRETIQQSLPPKNQLPPPFSQFLDLPELVESVVLEANFDGQQKGSLKITAVDDSAGNQIENMVDTGIQMGRQVLVGEMTRQIANLDPSMQLAFQAYFERAGQFMEDQIRPTRNQKTILFEAKNQGGQISNVAVIGTLTAMLLPAVQQAREAARRTSSMNNLKQIGLAFYNYFEVHRKFPSNIRDKDGRPLLSWRVAILPYLEESKLYDEFHLDEPWNSEHNIQLLSKMPQVFANPNLELENRTVYLGFEGNDTTFGEKTIGFAQILDGTANTILAVEANEDAAVNWSAPQDIPFDPALDVNTVGNLRPGGFNALLLDGSVMFFPNSIEQQALKNWIQKSDGNIVEDPYR
ncbi:DUF1559 domain-containing protein [bacterium]|nr:DUF1559 domain-containing protein [bacterium]